MTTQPDGDAAPDQPGPVDPGQLPLMPVQFATGLTEKDADGNRLAILRASDGTMTIDFHVPWQIAGQIGVGIAQGLARVQAQAQAEQGPQLILPNQSAGGLFLPQPGEPRPPLNGAGH